MNSEPQSSTPVTYQSNPAYDNEISLVEIVSVLLRRKKLILGITAATVCLGILYAFTQPRVYQVETILSPPSLENIQAFNLQNLQNLKPSTIYSNFNQIVLNRSVRKEFFIKSSILETLSGKPINNLTENEINSFFEGFSKSIKVIKSKEGSGDKIFLEGAYKEKLGVWLDSFVSFANNKAVEQWVGNENSDRTIKISNLKIQIDSKRKIHLYNIKNELDSLKEAYQIAKELGIDKHLFVPDINSPNVSTELNRISKSVSSLSNHSIYMKGTKVLKAEINALEKRKSDDLNIVGLNPLQEELAKLESIIINKGLLQAIMIGKKAAINVKTVGPKRKLIVILAFVLGIMLGFFAAFMMEFIRSFKRQMVKVDAV